MILTIHVRGTPRPQPRGRHVGGHVVSTADKKAKLWRTVIEWRAKEAMIRSGRYGMRGDFPLAGAVDVSTTWYFATPRADRWGTPHTHKPDRDNLDKLALDCLKSVGMLKDDCIVSDGTLRKRWAREGGCVIEVTPYESTMRDAAEPVAFGADVDESDALA